MDCLARRPARKALDSGGITISDAFQLARRREPLSHGYGRPPRARAHRHETQR